MSAHRFSIGKNFLWNEVTYKVIRILQNGQINIENILTEEVQTVPTSQLVAALFEGTLYFSVRDDTKSVTTEFLYFVLDDCPPLQRLVAEYRMWVIQPLLEMGAKKRTREVVYERIKAVATAVAQKSLPVALQEGGHSIRTSISIPSVYRWLDAYEKGGYDIRALIPNSAKQGGAGKRHLDEATETIIQSTIDEMYMHREKHTIENVFAEITLRVLEENQNRQKTQELPLTPPSQRTIARRIEHLGMKEKFIARHGTQAAKHEFTQFGQTNYPDTPMTRVEIDHTRIDLMVVDAEDNLPLGRPTLTVCIDTTTRYPLGYYLGFEPPSYLAVQECLRHAIRPKENVRETYGAEHDWSAYGLPLTLVVDNGKDFLGRNLEDSCLQLGIVLQRTPVKSPHFKSTIERFFGTINTGLFHTLPGTTFSNIFEKGDYNSLKTARLSLHELHQIIHIFVLDIYAQKFHRGLEGIPAKRWQKFIESGYLPRLPANLDELDILLGCVDARTVQPYGIELFSLRYNCLDLLGLRTRSRGQKVKIKYNPSDLSRIYAYDSYENHYIEVPSLDPEYTRNLPLWKHKLICAYAKKTEGKATVESFARARRKIQEIMNEAFEDRKGKTRAQIARWKGNSDSTGKLYSEETPQISTLEPVKSTQPSIPIPPPSSERNHKLTANELEAQGWRLIHSPRVLGGPQNDQ